MSAKINKTIVIEPICKNGQHVKFNAAYLKILLKNNKIIYLYSTKSHFEKIMCYLSVDEINNVVFFDTDNLPENEFIKSLIFFCKLIRKYNSGDKLILLSGDTFHLSSIAILSYIYQKIDFNIILHSILEKSQNDTTNKSKILFFRRLQFWLKIFSYKKNNHLILLSNSIRKNFIKVFKYKGSLFVHQHPYIYQKEFKIKKLSENRKIALVGIGDKSKGIDWLVTQLEKLNGKFPNYSFYLLGRNISGYHSKRLCEPCNKFLDDNEFSKLLDSMDYFIYPFDESSYGLRASGTIFDAISLRKPVITTKNDFVSELLDSNNIQYIHLSRYDNGILDLLNKLETISNEEYLKMQKSLDDFVKKVDL
ncbi:TPA: hypothetical protein ACX6RZ_002930 [Photobacterium damselae]